MSSSLLPIVLTDCSGRLIVGQKHDYLLDLFSMELHIRRPTVICPLFSVNFLLLTRVKNKVHPLVYMFVGGSNILNYMKSL